MIIRTKIDWLQNKELSETEKEFLEAKKEFEENFDSFNEEYEETEKNAIIDTDSDKLYIEVETERICMTRLLDGQYILAENGNMERIEERLFFKSTLDEIYNELIKNK